MRFALLFAACTSGGGGDGDADSDVDVDADTDADADSDCDQPCDCVDCAGHGVCVNVGGGSVACQCDEDWVQAEGPTCIASSVDDPDGYCAKNPIRCQTFEWTGLADDCGTDECVATWTQTFDLVADMWLYRIATEGGASIGCDCAEDVAVQWLVDGECVADGEGLVAEYVYTQAGLGPTETDVGRALVKGIHSLRGHRGAGCGHVDVASVRLELSPANP
jgi:hypothetical protein